MAGMCISALVEPEIAACTMMAFSKLSIVTMSWGRRFFSARNMACLPARSAAVRRSSHMAGSSAVPGNISPSDSAMICMVEAVPINEHAPQEGQAWCLYHLNFSSEISPRAHIAEYMPICSSVSRPGPASITPPVTMTVGRLVRPIAIRCAGTALSQLAMNTPASKVVARSWISIRLQIASRDARE